MTRYFRRRWEESRGDAHEAWGHSTWFFEVGSDGRALRQVEAYDDGPRKRYDIEHAEDDDGGLAQADIGTADDVEHWNRWEITRGEFESVWQLDES